MSRLLDDESVREEYQPPVPLLLAELSVFLSKHRYRDPEAAALCAKVEACIRRFNAATRGPRRREAPHEA